MGKGKEGEREKEKERERVSSTETPSCLSLSTSEKLSGEPHPAQEASNINGCVRLKDSQEHPRHKSCSPSCNEDFSPPPTKGKKKKKKSTRKKRRRSPSCSLSPLKKKKKKKNSKKRKRSSSSTPKSKRKEEKKHKKQPRTRSREEGHKARWKHARHSSKSAQKLDGAIEVTATTPSLGGPLQNSRSVSVNEMISKTGVSTDLFKKAEGQLGKLAKRNGEPHEYDSGNDTSSPPSTQTSTSKSKGREEASCQAPDGFGHLWSSAGRIRYTTRPVPGLPQADPVRQTPGPIRDLPATHPSRTREVPKAGAQGHDVAPVILDTPPLADREQDDKYGSIGKESHRHHGRRRRKPSYSPLRKRRRDSPSHLEARRITSARKRPIPYYRPSPSSSSPSSVSSYSSWYSCFSHSPSRSYSNSRTSQSRSRSWSSSGSSRSRSRSHSSGARNSRRSCSRSSGSTGSYDSMRR
ncbi:hypothetical protein JD844_014971 [Phrynosoma platyrhinos]|uniref:Serine/arginine repetitive matrix protein C-terminal domain-containing protein n=1 Tax=Phrynosoma platyrhinos TaxID=52577 RepID=A0ABQ7T7L1_PHRPL|nr:hypothetical protein JD844_014971 [Phrynosoma platyrhinos]